MLLENSYLAHLPLPVNLQLLLKPRSQEIEKSLMVIPCGQPYGLLNIKQSQKDDYFKQST